MGEEGDMSGGSGGGGMGGGDDTFGGGDEMSDSEAPDMGGDTSGGMPPIGGGDTEAPAPEGEAPSNSESPITDKPMESYKRKIDKLLVETKAKQSLTEIRRKNVYFDAYVEHIKKSKKPIEEEVNVTPIYDKAFLMNEDTIELANKLESFLINDSLIKEVAENEENDKKLLKEFTKKVIKNKK